MAVAEPAHSVGWSDTDNDGVLDLQQVDHASINGYPVAGNFDGSFSNGDEVGLFDGARWYLDSNHDFQVDRSFKTLITGYPIVGDFDGDGLDDLATYRDDVFFFDLAADGLGYDADLDHQADGSISLPFDGTRELPIASDLDGDGIDDIGLWVPDRTGTLPEAGSEWFFLVSGDPLANHRIADQLNTLNHLYEPGPIWERSLYSIR